jgi:hypothetical protein
MFTYDQQKLNRLYLKVSFPHRDEEANEKLKNIIEETSDYKILHWAMGLYVAVDLVELAAQKLVPPLGLVGKTPEVLTKALDAFQLQGVRPAVLKSLSYWSLSEEQQIKVGEIMVSTQSDQVFAAALECISKQGKRPTNRYLDTIGLRANHGIMPYRRYTNEIQKAIHEVLVRMDKK